MNGARSKFVARVEGPRVRGWVELVSNTRFGARAECAHAFRGCLVTLYERADDGFGYIKLGVVVAPAAQSIVDGVVLERNVS